MQPERRNPCVEQGEGRRGLQMRRVQDAEQLHEARPDPELELQRRLIPAIRLVLQNRIC